MTALEAEQAGAWTSDEELGEIAFREFPLYFARYGDSEAAYLRTLPGRGSERGRSSALQPGDLHGLRPANRARQRSAPPTLVITGEDDFITGPVCAEEIVAGLPDGHLVLVPGCGHFIFVEGPEAFRDAVLSFLRS